MIVGDEGFDIASLATAFHHAGLYVGESIGANPLPEGADGSCSRHWRV
jgi:hypothetical protein